LLDELFIKNPEKRLGFGPDGGKKIKAHPWFANVNWDQLLKKKIKPPFLPKVKNNTDVSNFDTEFTDCDVESY